MLVSSPPCPSDSDNRNQNTAHFLGTALLAEDLKDLEMNGMDYDCLAVKYGYFLAKGGYGEKLKASAFTLTGFLRTKEGNLRKESTCVRCGNPRNGTGVTLVKYHHGVNGAFCDDNVYSQRYEVPYPQPAGLFVEDKVQKSKLLELYQAFINMDPLNRLESVWTNFDAFVTNYYDNVLEGKKKKVYPTHVPIKGKKKGK